MSDELVSPAHPPMQILVGILAAIVLGTIGGRYAGFAGVLSGVITPLVIMVMDISARGVRHLPEKDRTMTAMLTPRLMASVTGAACFFAGFHRAWWVALLCLAGTFLMVRFISSWQQPPVIAGSGQG